MQHAAKISALFLVEMLIIMPLFNFSMIIARMDNIYKLLIASFFNPKFYSTRYIFFCFLS